MPREARSSPSVQAARGTHGLSTRAKLLSSAFFLVAILVTPHHWWPAFVTGILVLAGVKWRSQVPMRVLVRRWASVAPFLFVLAIGIPFSRGFASGWDLMASAFMKAMLSLTTILLLIETTSTASLLSGLVSLGAPKLLISIVSLMARYRFLFQDELARMNQAKRARTFHSRRWSDWRILPNFVGILFLRGLGRAERVHDAMLARGWNGDLPFDLEADDTESLPHSRDGRLDGRQQGAAQ